MKYQGNGLLCRATALLYHCSMPRYFRGRLSLGCRLLLLLALILGQGLLKNLQDLLIGDFLVRLELGQVPDSGATKLGNTILGDG